MNGPSIEQAGLVTMSGMRDHPHMQPLPYPASLRTVLGGAYLPSCRLRQSVAPEAEPRNPPLPPPAEPSQDVTQPERERTRV
jgi:hypothetical protein